MEQEDYLIREIQKIGVLLRAIFNRIFERGENLSITLERQFEETREMLLNEAGFDIEKLLSLGADETFGYLSRFKVLNPKNMELLAGILSQMGFDDDIVCSELYLKKALQLYEFCNSVDKTWSFDREAKMTALQNALTKTPDNCQEFGV